jgi:hypothetical protein
MGHGILVLRYNIFAILSLAVSNHHSDVAVPCLLPGVLSAPKSVALFGTTLYTTTNNALVQVSNVP